MVKEVNCSLDNWLTTVASQYCADESGNYIFIQQSAIEKAHFPPSQKKQPKTTLGRFSEVISYDIDDAKSYFIRQNKQNKSWWIMAEEWKW